MTCQNTAYTDSLSATYRDNLIPLRLFAILAPFMLLPLLKL